MANRGAGRRRQSRRQRRRENEARSVGAHGIDHRRSAGDIAAKRTECLGQRALDDVDPVHHPVALRDAAAARSVHAHRMHLVEIGHGAVAVGQIGNLLDRRDVAVHGIDRFKGHQLGPLRIGGFQQFLQMVQVVVPPDLFLRPRPAHPLNHRGVIELVR